MSSSVSSTPASARATAATSAIRALRIPSAGQPSR